MWSGEQPPGGQHPNPYQQPGYHQPNPYQNPSPGPYQTPSPDPGGNRGRNRTRLIAGIAAAAVVVAAGVTGFLMLGGAKHKGADPGPTGPASPSASSANPRASDARTATVKGWKVVTNPAQGIAFDVPPQWELLSRSWVTYVSKNGDPEDKPLIAIRNVAALKQKWCSSDDDGDGTAENTPLAEVGSRGNNGYRSTRQIAGSDSGTWVYGGYTQPDRKKVKQGPVEEFTTNSGLTGSLGTARSVGVQKSKKCTTDGKAWVFAFKNSAGDLVSWSFFGAANVPEEVPDATIRKIVATVRLAKISESDSDS
ncbi:hypothetical protein ACWCV9_32135 [Streptomyces sp. NPDC001606]